MSISKYVDFDLFLNRIKAHSAKQAFQQIAQESAALCGASAPDLLDLIQSRFDEGGAHGEKGVSVFDLKSVKIKSSLMFVATFDQGLDLNAHDAQSVHAFVGVLSPFSSGAAHLQRLDCVSRLFRSNDLCATLRETRNEDEMRVLFMPDQDWMIAA